MASMTMVQAIRSALDVMLGRDESVVIFGEDVGYFGGVFRCTEGLQVKYGSQRVFDAPISEGGLVGAAVSGRRSSSGSPTAPARIPLPTIPPSTGPPTTGRGSRLAIRSGG